MRARLVALSRSIRGQIAFAFLVMTGMLSAVGLHASYRIQHEGALVTETYDGALMAINYARAAAADFALMQVAALRLDRAADAPSRALLEGQLAELKRSLTEDLEIAKDRSGAARTDQAATRAQVAVEAWDQARRAPRAANDPTPGAALVDLAAHVRDTNHQLEMLVNYTAGDGFSYRQAARAAVQQDWWLNLGVIGVALTFSGVVAWLLARHIVQQVSAASGVAGRIALGQLDGPMPQGGADELGALLRSLAAMRENLRTMMQREVMQRQSAQGRLLDAMESSHEGIVVVDRDQRVTLANDQAVNLLGARGGTPGGAPGNVLGNVPGSAPGSAHVGSQPAVGSGWAAFAAGLPRPDARGEVAMPDGRWLHVSRSPTREGGFIAVIGDITAIKEQGARLEATNARLDTALANMSQGLCLFDAQGRLTVVNARYSELFNLPPGSVRLGMTLLEMVALRVEHGHHAGATVEGLVLEKMAAVARRKPAAFSLALTDGRILSVLLRPAPSGGWAMTYEDVTERRQAEEKVVFMARHDALTRLPNRTLFAERLQHALGRRKAPPSLAVLCLDLDRFKVVNDTLGHAMGDMLLQMVAARLQDCIRAEDTVSRVGGDEFTIIQTGPYNNEETVALARRIIEVTNQPYDLDGRRATVGVSVGIAVAPRDGSTSDALLRNADMALYRAKAEGRGILRFYSPEMDAGVRARLALGSALREALANGEFSLRYQPIYDLQQDRVRGFEALLRWEHPQLGAVPPSEFIPIAEELGLMVPIGTWVLQQACAEAAGWPARLSVSVNVSPAQFGAGQLVQTVKDALRSTGLPGQRLILEVTENVLFSKSASSLAMIEALCAMGVQVSLDDFGTGYSSLSYLASFPINQIKVDQSFIRNLADPSTKVIVRAIIGLAASLSLRVVAEGVETPEQLRWLRAEGCGGVQGYLLCQPLAPSALRAGADLRLDALAGAEAGGGR